MGAFCAIAAGPALAAPLQFSDREDGISCSYFDVGLLLAWPGGVAEWLDARQQRNGKSAYATVVNEQNDSRRVLRWEVSALVKAWASGQVPNDGLLLLAQGGGLEFHAREDADASLRPALSLVYADGATEYLAPAADAALDCSTYKGIGHRPTLHLSEQAKGVLRFDLDKLRRGKASAIRSAELILVRTPIQTWGRSSVAVFRLAAPLGSVGGAREDGLALGFSADQGIAKHPDVLFADGFEASRLSGAWKVEQLVRASMVARDDAQQFVPLNGKALRVIIPRGENLGLDLRYRFKPQHGREPDELYFRYYLRLAAGWTSASDGGKLPGFAATYGQAAWGGRPWHGGKGWSARGSFAQPVAKGHPAAGRVMVGNYVYHAEGDPIHGEVAPWMQGGVGGLLETDRWYCIEQHIKLNTPGKKDGVLRAWVDGRQVLERNTLRLRDLPDIHIEELWMNFFHGGTAPAVADMVAYVDALVIAKRYIGPMKP